MGTACSARVESGSGTFFKTDGMLVDTLLQVLHLPNVAQRCDAHVTVKNKIAAKHLWGKIEIA